MKCGPFLVLSCTWNSSSSPHRGCGTTYHTEIANLPITVQQTALSPSTPLAQLVPQAELAGTSTDAVAVSRNLPPVLAKVAEKIIEKNGDSIAHTFWEYQSPCWVILWQERGSSRKEDDLQGTRVGGLLQHEGT